MRILRVAQKIYPDAVGGGPYHVHAMSRDQAAMGHDVTVLTVDVELSRSHVEHRDGYTVVWYPAVAEPLGNALAPGIAQYLANGPDYDVIHAHSHLYAATNLAALKRRLGNTPLAITNHGLYSQNAPEWVFDLYLRTLGRWTFNAADVVFCYTASDGDRVRNLGVDSRIEIVANGVDTDRFKPDGPVSDRIDHDGPVVLFVGRLVEGKRPQDAIAAVARLPADLDAKLYVVGDGPMRPELEETADGRVEFLGHVSYDDMPGLYRSGDALVLPSRAEGLPRTVLEAFASGIPVVASHLDHTASLIQEAGETVDIGDIEGYADALKRVFEARDRLGTVGRSTVTERFRWQETVKETSAVLEELARKPPLRSL